MTHLEKYDMLNDFFGVSAIQILNVSRTYRERQMKVKMLNENFNVIDGNNHERLTRIVTALKRPIEKRGEMEIDLICPLLKEIEFFK